MAASLLIVNGPNLNMLGSREPEIYGTETLADIEAKCKKAAKAKGFGVDFVQSNHEGELVSLIQQKGAKAAGVIINAGAYTHTSVAILDALSMLKCPIIEVHLSNIFRREPFRHESYVSKAAMGIICGLGSKGYELAIDALAGLQGKKK